MKRNEGKGTMKKWETIYKASKYRDTTTGTQFEKKIEQFLIENGHKIERQVNIGKKRNDGKHIIDIRLNSVELISLKTQNVQGSAEEKVPFEIMKLQHAVDDYGYKSATLVLAGRDEAWTWKSYFTGKEYSNQIQKLYPNVRIIDEEQFTQEYMKRNSQ